MPAHYRNFDKAIAQFFTDAETLHKLFKNTVEAQTLSNLWKND